MKSEASNWQQSIEGKWFGRPAVFTPEGTCVGDIQVDRSSVFEDGRTTYYMDTRMDVAGPLRARFDAQEFAFGVRDGDRDRIYLGPDFVGAGHPYGALVDAHYYSPGWTADLRTMVHILADGATQVYSSLLYDGPAIAAVFNGVYKLGRSADELADFLAAERAAGPRPHVLPTKRRGRWTGELAVYDAAQQPAGTATAVLDYTPQTLLAADVELQVTGDVELRARFRRSRTGNKHVYEGPDLYGNAIGYGRALYTSQHVYGRALKLRGREFLIDDAYTMSVVWQVFASDRLLHVLFGALTWEPGEVVLGC